MKVSIAAGVGTVVLLLISVADASSQYRNRSARSNINSNNNIKSNSGISSNRKGTSSRSPRRRRSRPRSVIHEDGDNDNDIDWGSSYSSSSSPSSPNDDWDLEESSSASTSSSFYDFEDLRQNRRKTKKQKDKTRDIGETERILLALEHGSEEEEEPVRSKRSTPKRRHIHTKQNVSSLPLKSSKRKRRRRKRTVTDSRSDQDNTSIITQTPLATRAFVSRAPAVTRKHKQASVSSKSTAIITDMAVRQTPQPKSHPDRTAWEVPSYSHKVSTMMSNKNSETKSKSSPRRAAPTALPRTTRAAANPTASTATVTARVSSTARATVATAATSRSNRGTKPTVTASSSPPTSTLGTATTPWVRKFLAGRPKDRLLPLPRDYISDNFNLAQLPPIVERIGYQAMGDDAIPVAKALQQHRMNAAASQSQQPSKATSYPIYRRALRSMLADPANDEIEIGSDEDLIIPPYAIQKASEALYLLLHARFVISPRGLEAIRHVMALDNTVFGKCPRSICKGTGLLPYGYSNEYTSDPSIVVTAASRKEHDSCCHRYCPSCGEVWISWESKTDGCAWGPSWCHLFLLAFGSQVYAKELEAAAVAARAPQIQRQVQTQPQTQASPPAVRLSRGRGSMATSSSSSAASDQSNASEDLSRPTPSVFGFRIHPSTSFGRPLNKSLDTTQ